MHRWKLSALAAAASVSTALFSLDASALTLGPLRVDSALGETLRAEIPIPQATPSELSNLVVQIASPEAFRARGIDYSAAASAISVKLVRKPDGSPVLQLRSNTPLNDPFIDLLVDTQWNTGNLMRSYTILLDPPAHRSAAPQPPVAAQVPPASVTGRTYSSSPRRKITMAAQSATPAPAQDEATVRVRAGDTAGRIANANRPAGVSLDQMLVAMLRSNPNAFINGNVNRLRAGAVLQMPSREQALQTSAQEARQIVAAQSRDFNAYRRSLAAKAPQATVQAAARSASGQVQTQVTDTRPAADNADKLTLSKGSVQHAAEEARLAAQKQAQAQESRLSELQRNLAELNELAQSTAPAASAPGTQPAETAAAPAADSTTAAAEPASSPLPAVEVASANPALTEAASDAPPATDTAPGEAAGQPDAQPAPAAEATAAEAPPATEPAPTTAEAQPASAPALAPAAVPAPATEPETSLLDNPLIPAGGALIALLLGLLGYSVWKRRRAAQPADHDPSLGDSQLQPDTFFAGSGGQHVDTTDAGATTMAYAPSQLDGGADVDAVAEADVYLAYGRDVQAEEILKEALRTQPERAALHAKLAEIYAKRQDTQAFESTAQQLHSMAQPQSPEWQRVLELGRQLMPGNPLFADTAAAADAEEAAAPATPGKTSSFAAALQASTMATAAQDAAARDTAVSAPSPAAVPSAGAAADDGLAPLDFTLELPGGKAAAPASPDDAEPPVLDSQLDLSTPHTPTQPPTLLQDTAMSDSSNDLDMQAFEASLQQAMAETPAAQTDAVPQPPTHADGPDIDFEAADSPAPSAAPDAASNATAADDAAAPPQGLDFDLSALDLELPAADAPAEDAGTMHNPAEDPLATKLDLAREFNAIGDSEGARALIEEVLAEASGPLKARAQKMLSELD